LSTREIVTAELDVTAASERVEAFAPNSRGKALTHTAYLNGFASLLDAVVKGGVMAFVTPILVAQLGSSLFGVWQILGRLVSYMHAADGRPTQALKWVIANRQSIEDGETKRRHVGSAMGVWLLFLPLLMVMSAALIWISPHMTRVPQEQFTAIRITCALLVVNFLLIQLVSLPEAVLRGMNLGYKRLGLQATLNVVGGGLTLGALYIGSGLIGLAGAQAILTGITGLLFLAVVKKYVPWYGISRPTFAEVRSFLKLSVWWFAWTTIHKFIMASDLVVLGLVASTSAVTTYSLTGFAGVTLLSLVTIVLAAVMPGLGSVIGQQQFERAAALRIEMMAASWLLLTAIGATILLWNRSFLHLWVGDEHYAGPLTNLLMVLMIVQLIFIRNDTYVIDLTLQLREKVLMALLAVPLSLGLSAMLIPRLGIAGLCVGMIVGRLVLTISYPFIINKQFGLKAIPSFGPALRPAATMALMFGAATFLGERLLADRWVVWAMAAGLTFGLTFGIALIIGLPGDVRSALTKRLGMLRTVFD